MANFVGRASANLGLDARDRGMETSGRLSVGKRATRKLPVARSLARDGSRLSGDANTQLFALNGKPSNHHRTTTRAGHSASPIPNHRPAICKYRGRLFIPWQARPPLPRAGAIRLSHSLKQHNTRLIRSWPAFRPHPHQDGNLHLPQAHHQVSRPLACRHLPLALGLLLSTRNWPRSRRRSRNGCAISDSVSQRSAEEALWRLRKQTCPQSTCGRL